MLISHKLYALGVIYKKPKSPLTQHHNRFNESKNLTRF